MPGHEVVARGHLPVARGPQDLPADDRRRRTSTSARSCARTRPRSPADRENVLDLFPGCAERINQKAGTMSGGEQQMLAVGRALLGNPKLLLLDEPSMGLAPVLVDVIFDTIETDPRAGRDRAARRAERPGRAADRRLRLRARVRAGSTLQGPADGARARRIASPRRTSAAEGRPFLATPRGPCALPGRALYGCTYSYPASPSDPGRFVSVSRPSARVRPAERADIAVLVSLITSVDIRSGVFSGRGILDPDIVHLRERLGEIFGRTFPHVADRDR